MRKIYVKINFFLFFFSSKISSFFVDICCQTIVLRFGFVLRYFSRLNWSLSLLLVGSDFYWSIYFVPRFIQSLSTFHLFYGFTIHVAITHYIGQSLNKFVNFLQLPIFYTSCLFRMFFFLILR